jgi:hypothetical protein
VDKGTKDWYRRSVAYPYSDPLNECRKQDHTRKGVQKCPPIVWCEKMRALPPSQRIVIYKVGTNIGSSHTARISLYTTPATHNALLAYTEVLSELDDRKADIVKLQQDYRYTYCFFK